ncbi:hypothetical protein CsSME_00038178 [Camellia sinensis var. sinensis]
MQHTLAGVNYRSICGEFSVFYMIYRSFCDNLVNYFCNYSDLSYDKHQLRDELRKETLQLARDNLEKEPRIMELRNQCRIIRTTELAAAQEKLNELERQKEETLKFYSPKSLLNRLQEAMNKTDEESEILHRQLLEREIDVGVFVQKYKKLRSTYHRRALTHLAAKMSLSG